MTFAVTNTLAGTTTIDASKIDTNFTDVANILNAGLTTANLSGSAGILTTQLASSTFESYIVLPISNTRWIGAVANEVVALASIPGQSGTYTISAATWATTDSGDNLGAFKIDWGGFTGASNAWDVATSPGANIIAATTITSGAATNIPGQGNCTIATSSVVQHSSRPMFFGVICTTASATAVSTTDDLLIITIKIKHALV